MPELPEVETVRAGLEMSLKGATIQDVTLRREDLRVPFPPGFAETLAGRTITSVKRRAKYLLFGFDSEDILIAHLGMSGRFSVEPFSLKTPSTHDHVIFKLKDGRRVMYNDPRRFGLMVLTDKAHLAKHPLIADLGPEPLSEDFTASYLKKELLKRTAPVKTAIMDQKLVVGVGNIYASEALFLAGIHPEKSAKATASKADTLVDAIRKVLEDAIESGGSSLRDFLHVSGESGYFQHRFNVYGRKGKPCFTCGTPIADVRQAGRTTFYCKHCQK